MKKLAIGSFVVPAIAWSLQVMALDTNTCNRPDAPPVPAVESAIEADLLTSQSAIKAYNADGEKYLECLKNLEMNFTDETPKEDRDMIVTLYNGMVDDMHGVAEKFNQAVRAYKARAAK